MTNNEIFKHYTRGLISKEDQNYFFTIEFMLEFGEKAIIDNIKIFEKQEYKTKIVDTLMSDDFKEKRALIFEFFSNLIKGSSDYIDYFTTVGGV